jgi:hypothetical protein
MNATLKISDLKAHLLSTIQRVAHYHVIITLVIVMGTLAYAIYTVNNILALPTDQMYADSQQLTIVNGAFDKKTISKIDQLTDRQQNTTLTLPTGFRINPFAE